MRLGRLFLRSWQPFVMWLPAGFREPLTVWLVEEVSEQDDQVYQLGGFTNEREARACIAQLES